MRRSALSRGAGYKTQEWAAVRAELKTEFAAAGIVECELGYPGCWRDNALSFAHVDKRRHLKPNEIRAVILACMLCHARIEKLPRAAMRAIIEDVIASRSLRC